MIIHMFVWFLFDFILRKWRMFIVFHFINKRADDWIDLPFQVEIFLRVTWEDEWIQPQHRPELGVDVIWRYLHYQLFSCILPCTPVPVLAASSPSQTDPGQLHPILTDSRCTEKVSIPVYRPFESINIKLLSKSKISPSVLEAGIHTSSPSKWSSAN